MIGFPTQLKAKTTDGVNFFMVLVVCVIRLYLCLFIIVSLEITDITEWLTTVSFYTTNVHVLFKMFVSIAVIFSMIFPHLILHFFMKYL